MQSCSRLYGMMIFYVHQSFKGISISKIIMGKWLGHGLIIVYGHGYVKVALLFFPNFLDVS